MKNWKTTLSGILASAGMLASLFGVPDEVGSSIGTIGIFLMGIFSKDANVTGGTVKQ